MKQLYFGDNLDIMKKLLNEHREGFIDLIYIDPPFNSKRNYNVLFESIDIKDTKAQKEAFADTWSNVSYHDTLNEIQEMDLDLFKFLNALDEIKLSKSAISYLTTMAIRIYYMHKLLKNTGSFYLHCDSTMSHYLKLLCDMVFGISNFRNEIIWKRTNNPKGSQFKDKKYGVYTDSILFYTKSANYTFNLNNAKQKLTIEEIKMKYPYEDEKGRYYQGPIVCSKSMGPRPNLCYEYKNYFPPYQSGWRLSKEKLIELDNKGDLGWTKKGTPFRKLRPENDTGHPISSLWDDIFRLYSSSESLGYPTQKPLTLLERIINVSSNEGDLVADFFCGCGTTIAAAEKLNRNWIGVDISHLAIKLIIDRLTKPYPEPKQIEIRKSIEVSGFPKDIASAKELARNTDKHRVNFQDWVIEFMIGGVSNIKKSGDGGYDGYLTFPLPGEKRKGFGIIEVKSGNVSISTLRSFMDVVEKEKADIGVFVCFEEQITKGMRTEANAKGIIPGNAHRIQIITVEDLLDGKMPKIPHSSETEVFTKSTKRLDGNKTENLFE